MKKILFNCSLILMVFLSLDHLFVMFSFITTYRFLPVAFPLSILTSVLLYFYLEKRRTNRAEKIWTILLSFSVIIVSFLASAFYYDLSWDGQWYHQSAIYHIESGWNPITEPIRAFEVNNDTSIIHFPKSSWYYAASVFSTLGNFESGKSLNFIVIFISIFLIYSTLIDFGLSRIKSLTITLLVVLNPVVWSETTTYLVDGSLILYIGIYILMVFSWLRKPSYKSALLGCLAVIAIINLKFTGLVFLCVLSLFAVVYVLIYKREYLVKFIGAHAVAFLLAVFVFGYNPYVINYIERGHPFYPIMGTEEYPSVIELSGRDDNEVFETPHNMQGKRLVVRMFYANFGRPDNAPYYRERNAELIWPFTSKISDWNAYYFHETRVSGFGPYFSGILVLSFILLLILLKEDKRSRWIVCMTLIAISGSLIFSKHFWWPRFWPQMWLIPLIPVCFSFFRSISKRVNYFSWFIAVLILLNGCIVLFCHMGWETRSSIRLRKQLTEMKERNIPVEIFYGWFTKSMQEKMAHWQIEYETIPIQEIMEGEHMELTSVVEGYPNMVLYREKGEHLETGSGDQ